jgi:outer membrane protein assembly factor BamB
LSSGERVWKREFEQDFMFSGFIIEDGMLIANCEDTYTYRLDPSTGATIWRTKGAGTCSRMSYLNGVVYFVGGSTGYLHAVDAASGRVLWRIDGRRLGGGPFTTNAVYCVPGEGGARGRVIALTNRYAYCFEAAQ